MREKWMMLIALSLLTGCTDREADDRLLAMMPVSVDVSLSVELPTKDNTTRTDRPAKGSTTRMADDIVQTSESMFRGITPSGVWFVPFSIANGDSKVTANDSVKLNVVSATHYNATMSRAPYYYWTDCTFMQGVNAFLVYAQARRTGEGNSVNGALTLEHDIAYRPRSIRFSPVQIQPTQTAPEGAQAVADYLTRIANSSANGIAWKDINHALLDTLYNYFTNQNRSQSPQPMAGSAANALAHVKVVQRVLEAADLSATSGPNGIKTAILGNIRAQITVVGGDTCLMTPDLQGRIDYPVSLGLPDGAAVVKWNGTRFEPLIETTTTTNMNNITRYAYPPELWYRANSRIHTAQEKDDGQHNPADSTWAQLLAANYGGVNSSVNASVKAIAINDPLDYAVARMQLRLKDCGTKLKDADGEDITVSDGDFPLTGIIVGCQRTVDFEFKPITPDEADAYVRFVYDNQVAASDGTPRLWLKSGSGTSADAVSTLLLQTLDGEDVPLMLEFENKSSQTFRGLNGLVRPNTKFYLLGEITQKSFAPTSDTGDHTRRVFTQDYTTEVTAQVTSLAKAYNILPDLLSARLAVGVQLETKWAQSSTSYVILQ